jgi:hypothetical protein
MVRVGRWGGIQLFVWVLLCTVWSTPIARGDGVMARRMELGSAEALVASPRQEALLITDGERVTVVLRTHFERGPEEVAWIVPVPGKPEAIGPREGDLFRLLEQETTPRFYQRVHRAKPGFGCSAASLQEPISGVVHEASGTAGVFQYDVLSATAVEALTDWLKGHGYVVPPGFERVAGRYIERQFSFLALRVRADAVAGGTVAPHPITYTYRASTLEYPLVISGPSAADENEVVLYVLATSRYACANWTTLSLGDLYVQRMAGSPSGTDYELQFARLSAANGHLFMMEYALDISGTPLLRKLLPEESRVPLTHLTRLRAVIGPRQMDRDVLLEGAEGGFLLPEHWVKSPPRASSVSGASLFLLLAAGALVRKGRTWRGLGMMGVFCLL